MGWTKKKTLFSYDWLPAVQLLGAETGNKYSLWLIWHTCVHFSLSAWTFFCTQAKIVSSKQINCFGDLQIADCRFLFKQSLWCQTPTYFPFSPPAFLSVFSDLWCGESHPAGGLFQLPPARRPVFLSPGRETSHGARVQECRMLRLQPSAHQRPALWVPPGPGTPPWAQQLERAIRWQPVEDRTLGRSMFRLGTLLGRGRSVSSPVTD